MRETKARIMANVPDAVSSKIIANNTVEYRRADNARVVRLHQTDIMTYHPNGSVTLNSVLAHLISPHCT